MIYRVWHWLIGELREVQHRGEVQDTEVREALIRARRERVALQLAVQSRRWTSTG